MCVTFLCHSVSLLCAIIAQSLFLPFSFDFLTRHTFRGTIDSYEIGASFEPTASASVTKGEITFGGTDAIKFTGSITFTPITSTSPASEFWGIDRSVTFGTSMNILSSTAGIVDTGTTLVLIATDAFTRYQTAIGAVVDNATGLLCLATEYFANLKSLFFHVGGVHDAIDILHFFHWSLSYRHHLSHLLRRFSLTAR
ncbi:aspartic peptidase domain-containing protein [Gautieria morchelliformis]|nr:aspartic peptidase domain-containing protein [Gautieria morchelliformis]